MTNATATIARQAHYSVTAAASEPASPALTRARLAFDSHNVLGPFDVFQSPLNRPVSGWTGRDGSKIAGLSANLISLASLLFFGAVSICLRFRSSF